MYVYQYGAPNLNNVRRFRPLQRLLDVDEDAAGAEHLPEPGGSRPVHPGDEDPPASFRYAWTRMFWKLPAS
jgi:hypothetical protein